MDTKEMSETTNHTPGPWAVEPRKDGRGYWIDSLSDGTICQVMHDEKAYADARLIAAAPELLEALRMLLNVTPAEPPAAGKLIGAERRHYDAIMAAKAAIRKAEGIGCTKAEPSRTLTIYDPQKD